MPILYQNINLKSLYFFTVVVESGGFSQAEKKLYVSAGTVSNHMDVLEKTLGYRLCTRGRAGFALTPNGKIFYKSVLKYLNHSTDFWQKSTELKQILTGTVAIGCMDMSSNDINNKVHKILKKIHNDPKNTIDFQLSFMPSPDLEVEVLRGTLNMAICFSGNQHASLRYIPLYTEKQWLYCGKQHPLFNVPDTDISDDCLSQHIFSTRHYATQHPILNPSNIIGKSNNMEGHLMYVKSSIALGFLPVYMAAPFCQQGTMRPICKNRLYNEVPIYLVFPNIKKKTRLMQYALDTIYDVYGIGNR